MKKINLAIVGATGMVGRTFIKVIEERKLAYDNLYLFSSAKSAGEKLMVNGKEHTVEELNEHSFDRDIDIALFSAGGGISLKFAPIAAKNGVVVIDNSSTWRMDEMVPLVVPEVNPEAIKGHKGIIANPNCSTIQAMVALKPLQKAYGLKRVIYSTYQSVSGSGVAGIADLENGLKGEAPKNYPHPIANNCLPHIDVFMADGYTKEEIKMIEETKKILDDYDIRVTATTVRVPVTNSHAETIAVEFNRPFDLQDAVRHLADAPGIILQDDPQNNIYPTQLDATGKDEVFIGRVRRDNSVDNGLHMWCVADNVRKGAATNAVQIAQYMIENNLI
ncbi:MULTISPECIES: aspartate-semialdehyde dehydrogenase [unclassified Fusibacter]|uniref:aspartate-semialdehyde dehydrogenase n=1 Tax=unclassified Fusibacter TaxID=2624464 RepID=UPI001010A8C2|nr:MULTISPECIES: aspartate-semialdehyde dehydrogenase [unclassified Fusibacter]MCK8058693.1 aspartate-semialdehyde dehydrogenase [Fusibacter sp. A2]NPE21767.1 aspartate-semialdehyde dehydrogenase [Fusibacter sp. A1]RXV61341.1 aspartate-semialdehyde dehydrogenase [Fusibacter sp. A1]